MANISKPIGYPDEPNDAISRAVRGYAEGGRTGDSGGIRNDVTPGKKGNKPGKKGDKPKGDKPKGDKPKGAVISRRTRSRRARILLAPIGILSKT